MTWRVEEFGHVDSTQEVVKRRLAAGQTAGQTAGEAAGHPAAQGVDRLIVRARSQSAGRGRRGTPWRSDVGGSYQTFAVADPYGPGSGGGITLAIGVCLAEALQEAGVRAAVKWPNDLYYLNRKLGGVLVERTKGHLVIGVGINVENDVPRGAIALRSWPLATVHQLVLQGVDRALEMLAAEGGALSDELRRRYAQVDWLAGKSVTVGSFDPFVAPEEDAGGRLAGGRTRITSGVVVGIDQEGCLLLGRDVTGQSLGREEPAARGREASQGGQGRQGGQGSQSGQALARESKVWKLERVCSGTVLTIG